MCWIQSGGKAADGRCVGKDWAFTVGAVVAGGIVYLLYVSPPGWSIPNVWDLLAKTTVAPLVSPVVVLVVGTPENVEIMRRAINKDRIVASHKNSFALDQGRIIAASVDDAGESVTAAGWVERPLEIIAPPRARQPASSPTEGTTPLLHVPQLTQTEAIHLLNQTE